MVHLVFLREREFSLRRGYNEWKTFEYGIEIREDDGGMECRYR